MVKRTLGRSRWGPAPALALCVCALVVRVRAQDEVELRIEAPAKLVLGAEREVELRIHAPSPLTAAVTTNIGSLSEPEPSGPDEWRVRYTPPVTRYPQVAIFALVSADGAQLAWTRMALHGSATVELRSDPHVQVSVKVGDTTFGPVTTNARGTAAVAVVVPPGVTHAASTAKDALGNERVGSIPLDVPAITPLLSVCPPQDARDFLVFAARADAEPAPDLSLRAEASTVTAGQISVAQPGVYRVALQVPNAVKAGERAQLSAAIAGKPASVSRCELAVPLERPERIDVELSRARFSASETEPIEVRLVPHYPGVREKAAFTVALQADLGTLSDTSVSAREPVAVRWQLPQQLAGHSDVRLRLTGDLRRTLVLPLTAASLDTLSMEVSKARLPADGRSSAQLRVQARDAFGNPVRGARLELQALGSVDELQERAPGEYEATYRAPLGQAGEDRIVARDPDSGKKAQARIVLWSGSGRLWLAARVGYIENFARVAGPLAQLELGYRLPLLRERLSLSLLVGYYQSSTHVSSSAGGPTVRTELWAVPMQLRVHYAVPVGAVDLTPLLGGGALAAASKLSSTTVGSVREGHLVPMFTGGLAASLGLGPGRVALELAYELAVLHGDSVRGSAAGAHLSLGYTLPL